MKAAAFDKGLGQLIVIDSVIYLLRIYEVIC